MKFASPPSASTYARFASALSLGRARQLYYAAAIVMAALVPLIVFLGLWMRTVFSQSDRDLRAGLFSQASSLSARLDAQVQQQILSLRAIAEMPSLDEPDLGRFSTTASRVLAIFPQWAALSLVDVASGRLIFNTARPPGEPLPMTTAPNVVRQVAVTRQPALYTRYAAEDALYPEDAVLLHVPVIRENVVRHVLAAMVRAEAVQALLDDPNLLLVVLDERQRILARSRAAEEFRGHPANESLRQGIAGQMSGAFVAETLDGEKVFTAFQQSALTGWVAVAATNRRLYAATGERSTWVLVATGGLSLTLAAVLAVFLFENIMERRLSDERLAASRALSDLDSRLLEKTQEALAEQRKAASEREVLLREIYHRVKNNLQIIQSLLRLGSQGLDPRQREPFESAIRRIGAMAQVHTLLYTSPDLASIDFKDYLEALVSDTAEAFGADDRGIRVSLFAEPMCIPLDTAVPLAFIVVELLTNAFKHAFPEGPGGHVTVTTRHQDGEGVLTVADDGVGLPEEDERRPRSLGFNLVEKLVVQIGGRLERPEPGSSTFQVLFPLDPPMSQTLPPIITPPRERPARS